jgi:hypothetical protein
MYTSTSYTKTTNHNLNQDHFRNLHVFIESFNELEAYAIETYPNLAYFVESWAKFKRF